MNEYSPYLFESMARMKTQQLRTIPIGSSLTGEGAVLPYEEARRLIEGQSKILVAPCICRKEHTLVGGGLREIPGDLPGLLRGGPLLRKERHRPGHHPGGSAGDLAESRRRRAGAAADQRQENHQHLPLLRRLLPDFKKFCAVIPSPPRSCTPISWPGCAPTTASAARSAWTAAKWRP